MDLTPKTMLDKMGTPAAMKYQADNPRTDSLQLQKKVNTAIRYIQQGYAVGSKKVNDLLKDNSLVPTKVCLLRFLHCMADFLSLEHIFGPSKHLKSVCNDGVRYLSRMRAWNDCCPHAAPYPCSVHISRWRRTHSEA